MTVDERVRLQSRLRALMAKTVANGCTDGEEIAAARKAGELAGQLDCTGASTDRDPTAWAQRERQNSDYQALLERNVLEGLFKAAVQELSLYHINTVSPPKRKVAGQPVEHVQTRELLEPHLALVLGATETAVGQAVIARTIDELILDGQLPRTLIIPRGD